MFDESSFDVLRSNRKVENLFKYLELLSLRDTCITVIVSNRILLRYIIAGVDPCIC